MALALLRGKIANIKLSILGAEMLKCRVTVSCEEEAEGEEKKLVARKIKSFLGLNWKKEERGRERKD